RYREVGHQDDDRQRGGIENAGGEQDSADGEGFDSSEYEGTEDGACPEGSEEEAEAVGSLPEMLARDDRKQCPQRHGRDDEHDRPEHDPAYDGFMPDVASSGAEGR